MEEEIDSGLTAELTAKKNKSTGQVLSKGDARYWLEGTRLFKNHGAADYCCRFTTLGRREHFGLGSANKKTAAAKAAEIFRCIQADGWEAALSRYKPGLAKTQKVTIGAFIEEAAKLATVRPQTFSTYAKAFRRIVSDIQNIDNDGKYVDRRKGQSAWQKKVDKISLRLITPQKVNLWKIQKLKDADTDPTARARGTVTVNSLIRNAGSLFGRKLLPHIEESIKIPRPLPFEGVTLEKSPSLRYHSKIDAYAILANAKDELEIHSPEAFKILLLALFCGLRRSEIDNLLWRSFDFTNSKLVIESTEYHRLKSEDSTGEVDLDSDLNSMFQAWRKAKPSSLFVIESKNKPKPKASSRYYRCNTEFKFLLNWLRGQGIESLKPLHTLRKEIGSIIASEHGIFEASRFLRHSDIRITSAIYADKKKVVTPKVFKGLLGSSPNDNHTSDERK